MRIIPLLYKLFWTQKSTITQSSPWSCALMLEATVEPAMQTKYLNINFTSVQVTLHLTDIWDSICFFLSVGCDYTSAIRSRALTLLVLQEISCYSVWNGNLGVTLIWQYWVTKKRQCAKWNWFSNTRNLTHFINWAVLWKQAIMSEKNFYFDPQICADYSRSQIVSESEANFHPQTTAQSPAFAVLCLIPRTFKTL